MSKTFTELLMESHLKEQKRLNHLGVLPQKVEQLPDVELNSKDSNPEWIKHISAQDAKEFKQAQHLEKTKDIVNQNLRGQKTQFRRRRKKI